MSHSARRRRNTEQGTVLAVERLLAEGVPKTKIAKHLRIGRMTVYRLAKRLSAGPVARGVRCDGCGGLLESQPCLACALRNAQR